MAQEPQSQARAFVRQQSAPIMTPHAQQTQTPPRAAAYAHAGQQHSTHTSAITSPTLNDRDKQAHIRNVTKRQGLGLLVARAMPASPPPLPPFGYICFHNAVLSFTVMRLTNWDQSVTTLLKELRTNMDAIRGIFFPIFFSFFFCVFFGQW
jgi:hypothetical protein